MKNIVIAAGYATRLGEVTKNFPKPLLQIGSSTILGRMLDDIDRIPDIDEHIIISNGRFASIFKFWAKEQPTQSPSPWWTTEHFPMKSALEPCVTSFLQWINLNSMMTFWL